MRGSLGSVTMCTAQLLDTAAMVCFEQRWIDPLQRRLLWRCQCALPGALAPRAGLRRLVSAVVCVRCSRRRINWAFATYGTVPASSAFWIEFFDLMALMTGTPMGTPTAVGGSLWRSKRLLHRS